MSQITYLELHDRLAELSAKLLIETIPKWVNGEIAAQPQDDARATFTKIIKKEDGKIDWKKSAEIIERQIRAFYNWPGSFTFFEKNSKSLLLKIISAKIIKKDDLAAGETFFAGKEGEIEWRMMQ